MPFTNIQGAISTFDGIVARAGDADTAWSGLRDLARAVAGHRLFTVMTLDRDATVAYRVYTTDAAAYPVSGTKTIARDAWFDILHGHHRSFVANTLADVAQVFPDAVTLQALGCGSVVNLPVVLAGRLVATVNMLDEEQHYSPARVASIETHLAAPAKLAYLAAQQFEG